MIALLVSWCRRSQISLCGIDHSQVILKCIRNFWECGQGSKPLPIIPYNLCSKFLLQSLNERMWPGWVNKSLFTEMLLTECPLIDIVHAGPLSLECVELHPRTFHIKLLFSHASSAAQCTLLIMRKCIISSNSLSLLVQKERYITNMQPCFYFHMKEVYNCQNLWTQVIKQHDWMPKVVNLLEIINELISIFKNNNITE